MVPESVDWLPWRYQIGFAVETMTGRYSLSQALPILGAQWAWVAGLAVLASLLWKSGVKRFAAYGG